MRILFTLMILFCGVGIAGDSVSLTIDGMTCPFCAGSIEKQIKKIPGVERVDISLSDSKAVITLKDGKKVDPSLFEKAVKEAGFSVRKEKGPQK